MLREVELTQDGARTPIHVLLVLKPTHKFCFPDKGQRHRVKEMTLLLPAGRPGSTPRRFGPMVPPLPVRGRA